jgi:hypothetical protein
MGRLANTSLGSSYLRVTQVVSGTAAAVAELSGAASTVEEREKLAQAHVTGTHNCVAEVALPSGTAAAAAERSNTGTDNGRWLTVANGGLSALACDGEESAAASSSGELQAAAAASCERQQQRRAALCKLAHQALKQISIRSHHQRLCSRPEHSCGNDHCKTSATQMRGRLAATFYGCAQGL